MPSFRVGKPRVRLMLTANRTFGPGSAIITWDAVEFEEPTFWDPLTPTLIVIPRTGLYLLTASLYRASASGLSRVGIEIQVNGVVRAVSRGSSANNQTFEGHACSSVEELVYGDQVRANIPGTTGLSNTLAADGTFLAATRIGPERWTG